MTPDTEGVYQVSVRRCGRSDFHCYARRYFLVDAIAAAKTWLIGQDYPAAAMVIDQRKPLDSPCEWVSMAQRGDRARVRREEVVA